MGEKSLEEIREEAKAKLKQLLDTAKTEDEMIFDHGPLIIGLRERAPKDRFVDLQDQLNSQADQ